MKQKSRQMMRMVDQINRDNFTGRRVLTCYSCHRGGDRPRLTPTVDDIYDPPPPPQPDVITRGPDSPDAAQILDRYVQALGGAQRLRQLHSFIARGTEQEFGEAAKNPVNIYAETPGRQATVTTTEHGVRTVVCDGSSAWVAAPYEDSPVPLLPLSSGELDGARLDAHLAFPAQIKQLLTGWRVGFPYEIRGHQTEVVQGLMAGGAPVKFYFDRQSGLLLRQVRYSDTAVGMIPTQIDYGDYRVVAGVKIPFLRGLRRRRRTNHHATDGSSAPMLVIDRGESFTQPAPSPRSKPAVER